jgi:hypothetical protein
LNASAAMIWRSLSISPPRQQLQVGAYCSGPSSIGGLPLLRVPSYLPYQLQNNYPVTAVG